MYLMYILFCLLLSPQILEWGWGASTESQALWNFTGTDAPDSDTNGKTGSEVRVRDCNMVCMCV